MTEAEPLRPDPSSAEELLSALSLWLLRPELTAQAAAEACHAAAAAGLGAAAVLPFAAEAAMRAVEGSGTAVIAVAGFPHGSSTTAAKLYEARDLLRRGVRRIGFVLGTGMLLGREFQHVETELQQIGRSCEEHGATLHAMVESGWLGEDLRVIATKIAKRCGASGLFMSNGLPPEPDWPAALAQFRRIARDEIALGLMRCRMTLEEALDGWRRGARDFCCGNALDLAAQWRLRLEAQAASGG
jgi:deoxyribose-phosphate aldolase